MNLSKRLAKLQRRGWGCTVCVDWPEGIELRIVTKVVAPGDLLGSAERDERLQACPGCGRTPPKVVRVTEIHADLGEHQL